MVHPKGSWVPYKPFPSQKLQGNLVGDQSLHKVMFFGPLFGPPKGPWAFLGQGVGSGLQKWVPGSTISKLVNEKPCRTHWSMPQTEPYVASYGQVRFWGWGPQNWGWLPSLGRHLCPRGNGVDLGLWGCPKGRGRPPIWGAPPQKRIWP